MRITALPPRFAFAPAHLWLGSLLLASSCGSREQLDELEFGNDGLEYESGLQIERDAWMAVLREVPFSSHSRVFVDPALLKRTEESVPPRRDAFDAQGWGMGNEPKAVQDAFASAYEAILDPGGYASLLDVVPAGSAVRWAVRAFQEGDYIYSYSQMGFSPDRRYAAVYETMYCGPLCLNFEVLFLEREEGVWRIAYRVLLGVA